MSQHTQPRAHNEAAPLYRRMEERMLARVPVERLGSTADIVATVRYLLSPTADYVTGQVLGVDGGLQL